MEGEPEEKGEIVLTVGSPFPHSSDLGLADAGAEDATLVAQGYAALTALRGPRADEDRELLAQLDGGLERGARAVRLLRLSRGLATAARRVQSSSPGAPALPRLVWDRWRFSSTRRTWEPLVGLVGRRVGIDPEARVELGGQALERLLAVARLRA